MRFLPFRAIALICILFNPIVLQAQQGNPVTQKYEAALATFQGGDYPAAATAFQDFIKSYPSSGLNRNAQFFGGYSLFLSGQTDAAIQLLNEAIKPPADAEIAKAVALVLPQAMVQKASSLPPDSDERKNTLTEALKLFDEYIKNNPQSEEGETVNYQRAVAAFQLGQFDPAIVALRENLTKFATSESIFDSQYLLALAYLNKANKAAQDAQGQVTEDAGKLFDEAERLLRDIIAKRVDVALVNDAQMQLGDLLSIRSAYAAPDQRAKLIDGAMAAYREVASKERMIEAQKDRLTAIRARNEQARQAADVAMQKRLQSFFARESAKLAALSQRPGQAVAAKIKLGELHARKGEHDEARVVLRFAEQFAVDPDHKKRILFNLLLTYAQQVPAVSGADAKKELMAKALELHEKFQADHKDDPLGEGLPLIVGSMYLDPTPGINDPEKAAAFFKEAAGKGGAIGRQAAMREAAALAQLKRYDEAIAAYQKILQEKPPEAQAAEAEFGIAAIYKEQGKVDDALAGFREVRTARAQSAQAEQANFWVGQLMLQKGQAKEAATELKSFAEKYPESVLAPGALFALGKANQALGDLPGAVAAFEQAAEKYPQSDAAPFSYFERADILGKQGDGEQMIGMLKAFIEKYPSNPQLYTAYKSIAQHHQSQGDLAAATAAYQTMVEQHPEHPNASDAQLQIAAIWLKSAQDMGQYVLLDDASRIRWDEAVQNSIAAAEQVVEKFPDSGEVAGALQTVLAAQKLRLTAKQTTTEGIEEYFGSLSEKYASQPGARSKIQFTLASFLAERDSAKALAVMSAQYDPALKYAPGDIDLYGAALLNEGKVEESVKVYEKLAQDYPNPSEDAPKNAPLEVQQAQAIALYGLGRALQKQEKSAEAQQNFEKLKELYSWHPKLAEANYGIARALYEKKAHDEAMKPLLDVIRATNAETGLRARAMLLGGKIQEAIFEQAKAANKKQEADAALVGAIDYYKKIAPYFESETEQAAEGLWRAGQLLEVLASRP